MRSLPYASDRLLVWAASLALATLQSPPASAQSAASAPAEVGVVRAAADSVVRRNEFLGRIQAVDRVDVVARVTAYLDKRLFEEGAEIATGDRLYGLERGPFEADLEAKKAVVSQLKATLVNANLTLGRAQTLLNGPAGQQSTVDAATAQSLSLQAQIQAAEAQVRIAQINLDYTDIRSPIAGKIGRTNVTVGNVVTPGNGVLATIVGQDPMYVSFPVSYREFLDLRTYYADQGGLRAVAIRVRLPDGRTYGEIGRLDLVDNTIQSATDTIILRGTIANPLLGSARSGAVARQPRPANLAVRELADGEFVTVSLEGVRPQEVVSIPRSAILTDKEGDYVFVVGPSDKVEQRRVRLGQSTSTVAAITSGLEVGERVVAEGVQRVRVGQVVAATPAREAMAAEPREPSSKTSADAPGRESASAAATRVSH